MISSSRGALRYAFVALCGLLLCCVQGCSPDAPTVDVSHDETPAGVASPAQVRVVATTDFGTHTLFDATVVFEEGTTALELLQSVAEVETSYGGCFVEAINGVGETPNSGKQDWFYCMNGITADGGSCGYVLRDGDVEWWDFHGWSLRQNVSAAISCFPSAFVNGYDGQIRPTLVVFEEPFGPEAERILQTLSDAGTEGARIMPLASLASGEQETSNVVLVASSSAEPVREIYSLSDTLGLLTHLEDGVLRVRSVSGEEVARFTDGAGVLEAMQNPWNPSGIGACENVVLLVSGCDTAGVRAAAEALILAEGESLPMWCSALVVEGALEPVPGMTG